MQPQGSLFGTLLQGSLFETCQPAMRVRSSSLTTQACSCNTGSNFDDLIKATRQRAATRKHGSEPVSLDDEEDPEQASREDARAADNLQNGSAAGISANVNMPKVASIIPETDHLGWI